MGKASKARKHKRQQVPSLSVKVVGREQVQEADVLVAGDQSHFHDDVQAVCRECGRTVFHRPNLPPMKVICLGCLYPMMMQQGEEVELAVTRETLREVRQKLTEEQAGDAGLPPLAV